MSVGNTQRSASFAFSYFPALNGPISSFIVGHNLSRRTFNAKLWGTTFCRVSFRQVLLYKETDVYICHSVSRGMFPAAFTSQVFHTKFQSLAFSVYRISRFNSRHLSLSLSLARQGQTSYLLSLNDKRWLAAQ